MNTKNSFNEEVTTSLYVGCLMTPEDVAEALSERSPQEQQLFGGRWFLCCDVNSQMFDLLRTMQLSEIAQRATGFVSSQGGPYGVLTHQVGGHQHRLLLPLYDAEVQRAITSLTDQPFGFLMGHDNQADSVILMTSSVAGREMQGLPGLRKTVGEDVLKALIGELPDVVMTLAIPDKIPGLRNEPVCSVSLSVVMPYHSMMQVDENIGGLH